MSTATETCTYVDADGARCSCDFGINPATGRCWNHDPERRKKAQRARRKGAQVKAEKVRGNGARTVHPDDTPGELRTVEDAHRWAAWLVRAIATGEVDRGTGRDISTALRTFLETSQKADHAARLEELREMIATLQSDRRNGRGRA